jgi:hypothetical protein
MFTYGVSKTVQAQPLDVISYLAEQEREESGYNMAFYGKKNNEKTDFCTFNLAVDGKTGRYFAGSGGHVYTGKDIDDLLNVMASSLFRDYRPSFGSDILKPTSIYMEKNGQKFGFVVKPGSVYVKTRHGKKVISHARPTDGYVADHFNQDLRRAVEIVYDDNMMKNAHKYDGFREGGPTTPKSPKRNFGANPGRTVKGNKKTRAASSGIPPFGSRFFVQNQERPRRYVTREPTYDDY